MQYYFRLSYWLAYLTTCDRRCLGLYAFPGNTGQRKKLHWKSYGRMVRTSPKRTHMCALNGLADEEHAFAFGLMYVCYPLFIFIYFLFHILLHLPPLFPWERSEFLIFGGGREFRIFLQLYNVVLNVWIFILIYRCVTHLATTFVDNAGNYCLLQFSTWKHRNIKTAVL